MLLLTLLLCLSALRSWGGYVTSASGTRVTNTEDSERKEDTATEVLDTGTSGPGLAPRLAPDQPRTFTGLVGQRADMEVAFCEDAGNGTASLEWSVAGVTLHPGTWYTLGLSGGIKVECCFFVCFIVAAGTGACQPPLSEGTPGGRDARLPRSTTLLTTISGTRSRSSSATVTES